MEPQDYLPSLELDPAAPAWESRSSVRRALAAALEPEGEEWVESSRALAQLRERVEQWDTAGVREIVGISGARQETLTLRTRTWLTGRPLGAQTLPPWRRRLTYCGIGAVMTIALWSMASQHRPHTSATMSATYRTVPGQRSTVDLGNGSIMVLAPATTVIVTPNETKVVGEAYFQIASRRERPFVVRTTNAIVQVLGTTFTVRRYPRDPNSRVVVADGRVMVHAVVGDLARARPVVLSSRMLAQVSDSGVVATPGISVDPYTSWIHGQLVFDQVPLRDVIAELGRAYGTEIQLSDSTLAKTPVTITAKIGEHSLADLLLHLTTAVNAHYSMVGRVIVVAPGRTSPSGAPLAPPSSNRLLNKQPEMQYGR